jgi:hypothetical protein
MSDIVERLRNWRTVHLTQLRYVMESAADEIERLRLSEKKDYLESENAVSEDNGPAANSIPNHRTGCGECLTDEEREVLLAIEADAAYRAMWRTGQVVRGLLDRTK